MPTEPTARQEWPTTPSLRKLPVWYQAGERWGRMKDDAIESRSLGSGVGSGWE